MSAYAFNGMSIPHDEEGYLTDIGEWTPELADCSSPRARTSR